MPIKPVCDKCKNEPDEFGALLLSPPSKDNEIKKFHICVKCYRELGF
ncbi:MAG: hypothetical protein HY516_01855 [Candidatus Aenigmarchaeota archaeon]|nr:hypothetical protein [Candidatus Aenigmarchaeota archaeon]